MIATAPSSDILSAPVTKVNKSASHGRKSLRLSLRRFSHHGATSSSHKSSKNDSSQSDPNSSTLDLEIYPWSKCQQSILRLAQGQKLDAEERAKISVSIRNLVASSQNLANVLMGELFATSSLRAAFKTLASTFDKCSTINAIAALWIQFYTVILPDLHALLYAFEDLGLNDIRKLSFTGFRDAVVLDQNLCYGLLINENVNTHPVIQQMLFILEQNTRDGSPNFSKLQNLCETILDDFSISETSTFQLVSQSAPSPIFYFGEQEPPRQRSESPKPLQRFLRRAKGSFSVLTSGDQTDSDAAIGFSEMKQWQESRSRSPLARVKRALKIDSDGLPRRHSYAPGAT